MRSIRARLLVSLLALFGVAAAAMGLVTYRNALAETEALFDYQLRQMALSLRDQGEIAAAQIDTLADAELDVVIQIWTADGRAIYASRPHAAVPGRAVLGAATVPVGGRRWRTYAVATPSRVIQVAQPLEIRERLAARAAWRTVWPLVVLAPLAALGLAGLASWGLAPLRAMAADLRARDVHSLEPLAEPGLPAEMAPLAAEMNALLARLRQALDAQRAFVADAAHELRSPLTALKLQLELLRRAEDADPETRARARLALEEGIARATRLVEQLLALARSEPGAAPPERRRVDLADVARTAIADTHALAESRGVELELRVDGEPPIVAGDPLALQLLVRNLVDNAARYTSAGTRVVAALARSASGGTRLVVDDAGPGIPEAERARVFDRFVRRRQDDGSTGTGLGLAIVRSVATAHGATVRLDTAPAGGLRVVVDFPPPDRCGGPPEGHAMATGPTTRSGSG